MVLGVLCLVSAAALIAGRQSSPADVMRLDGPAMLSAPPEASAAAHDALAAPARLEPEKEAASSARVPDPAERASAGERSPAKPAVGPSRRPGAIPSTADTRAAASAVEATSPSPEPPAPEPTRNESTPAPGTEKGEPEASTPVTITGCLRLDDDTYVLKDTSGVNAPRARSWKSGFLRKRAASISLVDPASSLNLAQHVGRRVAITGSLVDREMRASSLQQVRVSCD